MTIAPETTDFALRALIRDVLEHSTDADPHRVAGAVLDKISDDDLRAACATALPEYVRHVIAGQRNAALHPAPTVLSETPSGKAPASGRSWKVSGLQDYGRALRQRVHVGNTPLDWKFLGDCETSDLAFVVAERRDVAARTAATADFYDRVIGLMQKHKARLVRDLPVKVLTDLFGGAE